MKPFNHRLSLTSICSAVLSLLGFGCSSFHEPEVMYGIPTGDFEVKGTVTDEAGGEVSKAEIRVTVPESPSGIFSLAGTTTDLKGNYEIKGYDFLPELKVVCIPEDSALQPDSIIVKMDYKNADKPNSWDHGQATATVNFTLKSSH